MAVEIVTGFQGKPHVTANDIACFNQGVVGSGEYILNIGKKFAAAVVTNNQIRIDDGEAVMQGVHFRIHPNTYINVTIENGNQGLKRKDAIVARYTKERSSGIEKIQIVVVKGTPSADNPLVPSLKKGDVRVGTELSEMLLHVVNIDGLNITSVTKSFEEVTSIADIDKKRLEKLSEIMVATQPGFLVDALALKELSSRFAKTLEEFDKGIRVDSSVQIAKTGGKTYNLAHTTTANDSFLVQGARYLQLGVKNMKTNSNILFLQSVIKNISNGHTYPLPGDATKVTAYYPQNGYVTAYLNNKGDVWSGCILETTILFSNNI